MRFIPRLGGALVVLTAALALMSGSALAATFSEQSAGSQTSSGAANYQNELAGCTITSAGTISGTPIALGTFTSTLTIFYTQYTPGPAPYAFCAPANGNATLVDGANPANTITKNESGQVCASSFGSDGSYSFIGSYTITGGTGIYSGASGTGTVNTFQSTQSSPFTGSEDGTINTTSEKPGKGCGDKNHLHQRQDECS
jgi:hypothetical protein